jgi:hypothetical protein
MGAVSRGDLQTLARQRRDDARLQIELDKARSANARLTANWAIVRRWSVESRNELIDRERGVAMVKAVAESSSGVFQWVQQRW